MERWAVERPRFGDCVVIPFGEWLPDQPALMNPGATVANNVIPKTKGSYGPLPSLSGYSDALSARCQGAFAARDASGNPTVFAGDASKLYQMSSASFADVSGTTYSAPADGMWRFAQYGQRVIATDYADRPQSFVLGSSSAFGNLNSNAPSARYVATWRDFLVFGNVADNAYGLGTMPNAVWWSGIDAPTSFPQPGTTTAAAAQSDYQPLPAGGWVQALLGAVGGADGLVICETSIYRVQYEGSPTIFRFDEIERARGTPAPGSVISNGRLGFYLGEDGFYANDGAQSISIGNSKVDKTFYADLDQSYFHRITTAVDPINKLVIWSYPGSGSGGSPNKLIVYNWELNRWSQGDAAVELIFRSLSEGYNLDNAGGLGWDVDSSPFGPDSRVWTGGRIVLSAFNTDHELSYFTGANLAATLETGEFADTDTGRRIFVNGVRPLVDGGTITAALKTRDTPQSATSTTTATSAGDDGICPQRVSCRYARAQVNIASGGSWNHAQGVEPYYSLEGMR